jgi:uncharacterized protein
MDTTVTNEQFNLAAFATLTLEQKEQLWWEAVHSGNVLAVQGLLKIGVSVDVKNWADQTALIIAVKNGNADLVNALITAGADVNAGAENTDARPLLIAAQKGYLGIMQSLLDVPAIDINITGQFGKNAVIIILHSLDVYDSGQKRNMARPLLTLPAFDVNKADEDGYTALHYAAIANEQFFVGDLLDHKDINVNATNKWGQTALAAAVANNSLKAASRLLWSNDINVNTSQPEWERSEPVLTTVVRKNKSDFLRKMLEVTGIDVNAQDTLEQSALDIAAELGHQECVDILLAVLGIDRSRYDQWLTRQPPNTPLNQARKVLGLKPVLD